MLESNGNRHSSSGPPVLEGSQSGFPLARPLSRSKESTRPQNSRRSLEKGATEDEMVGCHHWLSGHESKSRSVLSDSATPWTIYSPWNSPGQNTRVNTLSLLQQIFPTQELNWGLLHCRQILYQLSYQGSPKSPELLIYFFNNYLLNAYSVLDTGIENTVLKKPEKIPSFHVTYILWG